MAAILEIAWGTQNCARPTLPRGWDLLHRARAQRPEASAGRQSVALSQYEKDYSGSSAVAQLTPGVNSVSPNLF